MLMSRLPSVFAIWAGVLGAVLVLAAVMGSTPAHAQAQDQDATEAVLRGVVRHGGDAGDFDPAAATVSLVVVDEMTEVDTATAQPDASGNFEFPVDVQPGRLYFLSIEYQGARYSTSVEASNLGEQAVLDVYDATHDPEVLAVESHTIIVTGAVPEDGFLEVWERVAVRNDSGLTLVPDQGATEPAMPSFLRFGLPSGYYNLDVGSSVVGGDVLEVDRGFALDMPIPPTGEAPHQFDFIYRLPYDSSDLDLSRVMRFGAERFFIAVPVDVAHPVAPQLEDLGAAESDGRLLRVLSGQDIGRGETLTLTITELPLPSAWTRFSQAAGGWYLRIGAPLLVGVAGLGLLGFALRQRTSAGQVPADLGAEDQRQLLLERVADLEERHHAGEVSTGRYAAEREQLKQALLRVEMRLRLHLEAPGT
ncbi:MAG: hypothetical protein WD645_06495 [Dehalococcoidia bacterium]